MAEIQPILVEEDVYFNPFRGLRNFLTADLTEAYLNKGSAVALEREIDFEGIKGFIRAFAQPNYLSTLSSEYEHFLTPLGEVQLLITALDGRLRVEEAPLTFRTTFQPRSMNQLERLNRYVVEFNAGRETFHLPQAWGDSYHDGLKLDIANPRTGFANVNSMAVRKIEVANSLTDSQMVLLPYNLFMLSEVQARLTKRTYGRFLKYNKWVDDPNDYSANY